MGRDKWDLWNTCEAKRVTGSHQYKRFNVDGRYVKRCRSCERPLKQMKYMTPKSIIEEWLSGNIGEEIRYEYLGQISAWSDDDDPDNEKLRKAYGLPLEKEGVEIPSGLLMGAVDLAARQGKKLSRILNLQNVVKLQAKPLTAEIKRLLEGRGVGVYKERVGGCLFSFMLHPALFKHPLPAHQLRILCAAVAYHYQKNVAGMTLTMRDIEGLYGDVSHPTLVEWSGFVKSYCCPFNVHREATPTPWPPKITLLQGKLYDFISSFLNEVKHGSKFPPFTPPILSKGYNLFFISSEDEVRILMLTKEDIRKKYKEYEVLRLQAEPLTPDLERYCKHFLRTLKLYE